MFNLIILTILAILFGYFATQNTSTVTLVFDVFTLSDVPLYLIIGTSLLFGLALSWLINLVNMIIINIKLKGIRGVVKQSKLTIHELSKKVNSLELENARLNGKLEKDVLQENSI